MFLFINLGIGLLTLFMIFSLMSKLDQVQRQLSTIAKRLAQAGTQAAAGTSPESPGAAEA